MANESAITPEQTDFNALLFPGRKMLYVNEVAERLGVDDQQVRNYIDEGLLHAIDVGTGERKFWRIPVTSFERFLKERSSQKDQSLATSSATTKKF